MKRSKDELRKSIQQQIDLFYREMCHRVILKDTPDGRFALHRVVETVAEERPFNVETGEEIEARMQDVVVLVALHGLRSLAEEMEKNGRPPDAVVTLDAVGTRSLFAGATIIGSYWVNVHQPCNVVDIPARILPGPGHLISGLLSLLSTPFGVGLDDTFATLGGQYGEEDGANENFEAGAKHHADAQGMPDKAMRGSAAIGAILRGVGIR